MTKKANIKIEWADGSHVSTPKMPTELTLYYTTYSTITVPNKIARKMKEAQRDPENPQSFDPKKPWTFGNKWGNIFYTDDDGVEHEIKGLLNDCDFKRAENCEWDAEGDEDEECPNCLETKCDVEFKTRLPGGEGDTYVCEDCFNKIEEEDEDEEDEEDDEENDEEEGAPPPLKKCLSIEQREWSHLVMTTEDEEWEEIYNSTGDMPGIPLEKWWEPGTFYQTSPNGSGPSVTEGYWVRTGGNAVWKVEGHDFHHISGAILEVGFKKCRLRLLIK
jgi:hypothetical protein